MVARARLVEDLVTGQAEHGVGQYVPLGGWCLLRRSRFAIRRVI
jgi:hypothetical protein